MLKKVKLMKYLREILGFVIVGGVMALVLLPLAADADSEDAVTLLDGLGASFIVHNKGESLSVITYDWKTPDETCKTLTTAGIKVDRVVNYGIKDDKPSVMTFKNCLVAN